MLTFFLIFRLILPADQSMAMRVPSKRPKQIKSLTRTPNRAGESGSALEARLRGVWSQEVELKRAKRLSTAFSRFQYACESSGLPSTPIQYLGVMAYVFDYVEHYARGSSTRSVSNALSDLRCSCRRAGRDWLTDQDACLVKRAVALLKLTDVTPSKQSEALTLDVLRAVIGGMDLSEDEQLGEATQYLVYHQGLFRLDEMHPAGGLRTSHIRWSVGRRSLKMKLLRTKTHREGEALWVEMADAGGSMSGVRLLRKWYDRRQLWNSADAMVFPQFTHYATGVGGRINLANPYSISMLVQRLRLRLVKLGLDGRLFSGHGFRAGGATDLFNARLPLPLVMKAGRWKTAVACLRYYRQNSILAEVVAQIFAGRRVEGGNLAALALGGSANR